MKCKWCGAKLYFWRDRELGGGMMVEKDTGESHVCKPFLEWEKSIGLQGPSLSKARYDLWLLGPEKAKKRVDLQEKAKQPLLPNKFFKSAKIVQVTKEAE